MKTGLTMGDLPSVREGCFPDSGRTSGQLGGTTSVASRRLGCQQGPPLCRGGAWTNTP